MGDSENRASLRLTCLPCTARTDGVMTAAGYLAFVRKPVRADFNQPTRTNIDLTLQIVGTTGFAYVNPWLYNFLMLRQPPANTTPGATRVRYCEFQGAKFFF